MYAVGTLAHTTSSAHTVCTHTVVPGAWQREHATTHEAPWERHDSATDADFRERNRRCADRPGTLFLAREKRLLVRHRKDDGPLEGRRPVDLQLASRGVKKTLWASDPGQRNFETRHTAFWLEVQPRLLFPCNLHHLSKLMLSASSPTILVFDRSLKTNKLY